MSTKRTRKVLLVHRDEAEARDLAATLRRHGWQVALWKPTLRLTDVKKHSPTAVAISLRRLPSHGREVADALSYTKWGRAIPIVFFDGAPDKVSVTREKFPAAAYTTWAELPTELDRLHVEGGRK